MCACVPLGHAHQSVSDLVPPGPRENKGCAWVTCEAAAHAPLRKKKKNTAVEPHTAAIADPTCQIGRSGKGGYETRGPDAYSSPVKQRDGEPACRGGRGLTLCVCAELEPLQPPCLQMQPVCQPIRPRSLIPVCIAAFSSKGGHATQAEGTTMTTW